VCGQITCDSRTCRMNIQPEGKVPRSQRATIFSCIPQGGFRSADALICMQIERHTINGYDPAIGTAIGLAEGLN
jgi:hypothetical protein